MDAKLSPQQAHHGHELLSSKLLSKLPAESILDGVYAVSTLAEALNLRDSLAANESVVTLDGVWLGRNWLRITKRSVKNPALLRGKKKLAN